jgi:hypothetical protein
MDMDMDMDVGGNRFPVILHGCKDHGSECYTVFGTMVLEPLDREIKASKLSKMMGT